MKQVKDSPSVTRLQVKAESHDTRESSHYSTSKVTPLGCCPVALPLCRIRFPEVLPFRALSLFRPVFPLLCKDPVRGHLKVLSAKSGGFDYKDTLLGFS